MTTAAPLGNGLLAIYALPALATQLILAPVFSVLPGIYTIDFGLAPTSVGLALIIMRLWDAVTDPLVGTLSDRTKSRIGRRKPFMIGGFAIATLGAWLVFAPPVQPTLLSFTLAGLIFFLGWTVMEIPHTAWGNELTRDPGGRSRVFFFRSLWGVVGGLAFTLLPYAPWSSTDGQINAQTLREVAVAFVILGGSAVLLCCLAVPDRNGPIIADKGFGLGSSRAYLKSFTRNLPFWRLLIAFTIAGIGIGIFNALQFIYLKSYMGFGDRIPVVLAGSFAAALVALPIWVKIIARLGKARAWCLSFTLIILCIVPIAFLPPGMASFPAYMALALGVALSAGAGIIVPFSLLGDVVDYDTLKTGLARSGVYTAFLLLVVKANGAFSGGAAFIALDWIGFDPAATTHEDAAILGLKLLFCGAPAVLLSCAVAVMWTFPINARRHEIIRRRLEWRKPAQ